MSEHIKTLETKLQKLQQLHNKAASENFAEQLLLIIHRPGWTTPQEAQLVHAVLDSLTHQLEGVEGTQRALLAAAEQIGKT
jgi:hypothetical protein